MKDGLDITHCLELQLANERVQRAHADARTAAANIEIANLVMHTTRLTISHIYGLSEGDHMDFSTGAITRKPKLEALADAAPPLLAGPLARS